MAAAAIVDLQVRADKIIREWTGGECVCYAEQVPCRVIVTCLSFASASAAAGG
jgi:hypothetical protein